MKLVKPGIDGMVGAFVSSVLMLIAARCLLQDTKSCCPVGLYVVPSFDLSVTVRASAFHPATWEGDKALKALENPCNWLRTAVCAGVRG